MSARTNRHVVSIRTNHWWIACSDVERGSELVRARDRKLRSKDGPELPRSERFLVTERRAKRAEYVIGKRPPTLTVVLEDVYDRHNASAVLRSCDGVGVKD